MTTRTKSVKAALDGARPVDDAPFDPSAVAGDDVAAVRRRSRKKPANDDAVGSGSPKGSAEPDRGEDDPERISAADMAIARECADLDQNDRDNGRRLILWFGSDLVYVAGMGWLVWEATHWQRDEGELRARLFAQDIVDKIKLECLVLGEPGPRQKIVLELAAEIMKKPPEEMSLADKQTIKKAEAIATSIAERVVGRRKFAVSTGNAAKTSAMLSQAASRKAVKADALDRDHMKFNTRNQTLAFVEELDPERPEGSDRMHWTFAVGDHQRADLITKEADVAFDPTAECPGFTAFLERVQPDAKMRTFLQVAHGYAALLGGNPEQVMIFHHGEGANGKSAFLETIGRVVGQYRAVAAPESIAGDQQRDASKANSDIARLHSARFVTIEELPRGVQIKENLVKALTGGTKLTARFLMKEFFEFEPEFTAVLTSNDKPNISGLDYGIWRRILLVPWGVIIPVEERDKHLVDKLMKSERAGILNWLIDGALTYLQEGLAPHTPAIVTDYTADYREERDHIQSFVRTCLEDAPGERLGAKVVYKTYTIWCEHNAIKPFSQTAFGTQMAKRYKKDRGRIFTYLDVKITAEDYLNEAQHRPDDPPARDKGDPGWEPKL